MRKQKKPATTTTTTTTPPVVVKDIVLPEHASARLVSFEGLELEVSDEQNPRVDVYEIVFGPSTSLGYEMRSGASDEEDVDVDE